MKNDDQKITWKKANTKQNQSSISENEQENQETKDFLGEGEASDLAKRFVDHKENSIKIDNPAPDKNSAAELSHLQDDIKNLLEGIDNNDIPKQVEQNTLNNSENEFLRDQKEEEKNMKKNESSPDSAAVIAAMGAISHTENTSEQKENSIDLIKESIKKKIDNNENTKDLDEDTKELLEKKEKMKGIEHTYFSDMSEAMGSNKPSTMSELLRKARYDQKEKEIFSPKSKKNIAYIIGAIILLGLSIGLVASLLGKKEVVKYITDKKVASLVYSDLDTGINTSGNETEKIKQAIRKVVETKIPEGSIHQIYYVGEDSFANIRRFGTKQVFDLTESDPPEILYENIENQFMHGIYKTDKNHPFIILKALSYDRAFEGMKQWESTIVDDLSTYFDLPVEAGDRSLMEVGFSDDLIKNKNVRVARFLPREVDRRGIFGIFEPAKESTTNEVLSYFKKGIKNFVLNSADYAYAQISFETQDGGTTDTVDDNMKNNNICYEAVKECYNKSGEKVPYQIGNTDISCSNIIVPNGRVVRPGDELWFFSNIPSSSYSCIRITETNEGIDTFSKDKVCFNADTGNRVYGKDNSSGNDLCFESYQCRTYECSLNGQSVNTRREGEPGVLCGEKRTLLAEEIDTYAGQKICRSYPELLNLQNIQSKNICFDQEGNYVEASSTNTNGSLSSNINCILPINRDATMCINNQNKVVFKEIGVPESAYQFCFKPLNGTTSLIDEQFQQNYEGLSEKAVVIAVELKALSLLLDVTGLDGGLKNTLNDASSFFFNLGLRDLVNPGNQNDVFGNILEDEEQRQLIGIVKNLDLILNYIDPYGETLNKSNGELSLAGRLRNLIELIKSSFGYSHNVGWSALGNGFPLGFKLPNGELIKAGQEVYTNEEIEVTEGVQQTLVLIGLMDSISVTGQLDLVTQDAISAFQSLNGIPQTGVIDQETINILNNILSGEGSLYGGDESSSIDDYIGDSMGIGTYNEEVEWLQILLYAEGYGLDSLDGSGSINGVNGTETNILDSYDAVKNLDNFGGIDGIDGLYDEQVCLAVQAYQRDNNLEVSDSVSCSLNIGTIESLNNLIKSKNYLGTGFSIDTNGSLKGHGNLQGIFGPGTIDFGVNSAEADSLKEGDIILMYTFLDEKTILITRHESVITEIIKRRAFNDIFNNS